MNSQTRTAVEATRSSTTLPWVVIAIGFVVLMILPQLVYPLLIMKIMCFAIFAASFNLLFGYTGLLSFGHAAFFGSAAYCVAYLRKSFEIEPLLALILGIAVAAALGFVMGVLAVRRQGVYFSMITLALSQMVYFIILQAPFAQGEDGLQGVPRGDLLGVISLANPTTIYVMISLLFIAALAFVWRVVNSPFGMIMRAIKEDAARAESMGYDVGKFKLKMFVLSAGLAGLAGGMKVMIFQFATLNDVTWQASGEPILMTLIGGIGTLAGPVVGAAIVVVIQNYLATSPLPVTLFTGIIFILCVMLFRRGVVGELLQTRFVKSLMSRLPRGGKE